MPETEANGVRLYYEIHGTGEPLVLVHGSWVDATRWRLVVPGLAESFRALETLNLAPAHVVTNSFGGNIALRLAARRPEIFHSLCCHEPPFWSLLDGDPQRQHILRQGTRSLDAVGRRITDGDHEGAARQFGEEVSFGPGAWENELDPETRAILVRNAPTFLDELQDPKQLRVDEDALSQLELSVRLTQGSESPAMFPAVIDRLIQLMPHAGRKTIAGAGHVPQLTHPERYVDAVTRVARENAPATEGLR